MTRVEDRRFPFFDRSVPHNGYAWWYVDAVSDDGTEALTLIAFIGSVFSPYYAWARRKQPAQPLDHCALNVALYRPEGKRWAMTERPQSAVSRSSRSLEIGPSSLTWDGQSLTFQIDEWTVPLPSRIHGQVRVWPSAIATEEFTLDQQGRHVWRPMAPCARVEVTMTNPGLRWSGNAYWDSNHGDRPLEQDFDSWHWSRASSRDRSLILYEGNWREAGAFSLALEAGTDGSLSSFEPPEPARLDTSRWWRIARQTRADNGQAMVVKTLEDTPFYARSLIEKNLLNEPAVMVHESLSMDRFRSSWVHCLLPFRMPRTRR